MNRLALEQQIFISGMNSYQIAKTPQLITITPKHHKHSLIWINGLAYYPQTNLNDLVQTLGKHLENVKVLIPRAPIRYVTVMDKQTRSWFDIKFRGKKSFEVPFDQAFNSGQVHDSYETVLKPLIDSERQILDKNAEKGILMVSGFSQGCGMSLHSLYESKKVDCILGISGYLFPISKFDPEDKRLKRIIYGLSDDLRPWEFTKMTYEGKIEQENFVLVPGMAHEINADTQKEMKVYFDQVFS